MRYLSVLGATGSIGTSTLDIVARHPERFRVHALCAHGNVEKLVALVRRFQPEVVVLADAAAVPALRARLRADDLSAERVVGGREALLAAAAAPQADTVVAGIVGVAGLEPTLAAVRAGKRVLLANKESLVVAGELVMAEARRCGAELLPVDSEHNGLAQCLPPTARCGALREAGVERLTLTASGGPLRTRNLDSLSAVTPEEACAHPTWSMGRKISVDSATMMNKGLELIEACWLFGVEPAQITVVIHPQSVVHALVGYRDGSVLAHLGNPDMRTPLAHALGAPERLDAGVAALDLFAVARLEFERPEPERFPCLGLAYAAMDAGGVAPAALNAANEAAVASFLERRIHFTDIPALIHTGMERVAPHPDEDLSDLLRADMEARQAVNEAIARRAI